jgi:hypothetical protein
MVKLTKKAKGRAQADVEHHKKGKLAEGRFSDFEKYVASEGHGLILDQAMAKADAGQKFIQEIQQTGKPITGTSREENLSNLMWFLAKQSIEMKRPMDAGSFTLGIGNKNETKALHDYFAGEKATSRPIRRATVGFFANIITGVLNIVPAVLNILPAIVGSAHRLPYIPPLSSLINWLSGGKLFREDRLAYGRGSTHFKKQVTKGNKGNHFGYDILHDKNVLPGKGKTVVFGLMEGGRMYLKAEEHGMDPLHQPGEAFLHSTAGFGPSLFNRIKAKLGIGKSATLSNAAGVAGQERALKEHRVTEPEVIKIYKVALNDKRAALISMKNALEIQASSSMHDPKTKTKIRKQLTSIDKEIKKIRKIIQSPKGDIEKMSKTILGGILNETEGLTTVQALNAQFKQDISKLYNSPHGTPQHGDEIALSINKNGERATFEADPLKSASPPPNHSILETFPSKPKGFQSDLSDKKASQPPPLFAFEGNKGAMSPLLSSENSIMTKINRPKHP